MGSGGWLGRAWLWPGMKTVHTGGCDVMGGVTAACCMLGDVCDAVVVPGSSYFVWICYMNFESGMFWQ